MLGSGPTILVDEPIGLRRTAEPIRVGVPWPRGQVFDGEDVQLRDQHGPSVACQPRVLARWPDGSVKWLLVDAVVDAGPRERIALHLSRARADGITGAKRDAAGPKVLEDPDRLVVDTGVAKFVISRHAFGPIAAVTMDGVELMSREGMHTALRLIDGHSGAAVVDRVAVEVAGAIRADVVLEGSFKYGNRVLPVRFKARLSFFTGSACVRAEFMVRNPEPARHPGGLWDLGDPGSFVFKDLSMHVPVTAPAGELEWHAEDAFRSEHGAFARFCLYQDSSGGENWDSPNHIDGAGKPTVSFRGYRIKADAGSGMETIGKGYRASPSLRVVTQGGWVAATTADFWQNFPKALRWEDGRLSIGLFPGEYWASFELQGGEQKRHVVWFEFGLAQSEPAIARVQCPLAVVIAPVWVEATRTIPYFVAAEHEGETVCSDYVRNIVEGPNAFCRKREVADEYGWRHFGDLYADHEAVHHAGPKPLVSHYNNQYDFIYGALVQFLRTGDARWRRLMEDAACHVTDIDIYHTTADRAAYNGGLFWHTDHYKDAATSSHRCYSRRNGGSGYGGGPSSEHNYSSGLFYYYYLTGDPESAGAVIDLAKWVIAMDDGSRHLFGLIDSGPSGLASKTASDDYHGPGRGAGNSINALLDAYRLSADRRYMNKAEELMQRCIHPADNIAARGLDEPEYRWSYLVFLQVLGKYLDIKVELGEIGYLFQYARESLLAYAKWMLENEVPYKEVLHKVLIPTETWPAHDIRKGHVLHVAAEYAGPKSGAALARRARYFFDRCMEDLLSFDTAYLTRPLVILSVYGHVHNYFQRYGMTSDREWPHTYNFGQPQDFRPQSARVKAELRRKMRVAAAELRRIVGEKLGALGKHLLRRRWDHGHV